MTPQEAAKLVAENITQEDVDRAMCRAIDRLILGVTKQGDELLAAYADAVLNTCSFCKHCQYIEDERIHYCMLHKKDILPEQQQCKDHE